MDIAVICAAGRSGKTIVSEAASRGHNVTAFIRPSDNAPDFPPEVVIEIRDLFDLDRETLRRFDAVIDCFGVWDDSLAELHIKSVKHLCACLSGEKARLLIVGGAGSLYTDSGHKRKFHEEPSFPADMKVISAAQARSFDELIKHNDVRWTYVCPNGIYDYDRPSTGRYEIAGEEIVKNDIGEVPIHSVSYGNLAAAMVFLLESGDAVNKRVSVYDV